MAFIWILYIFKIPAYLFMIDFVKNKSIALVAFELNGFLQV